MKLRVIILLTLWGGLLTVGCATTTNLAADGTPLYEVTAKTLDGLPVAGEGPTSAPTLTITAGAKITKVWISLPMPGAKSPKVPAPAQFTSSAKELESGIVIETSWDTLILYNVTTTEMRLGTAKIDVPSNPKPAVLQLEFKPATREMP